MNHTQLTNLRFVLYVLAFHFLFPANAKATAKRTEKKPKTAFLFIEWKHHENKVLLGHFENKSTKKIDIISFPELLTETQLQSWLKGNKAILVFHCMWGQQRWFHKIKYLNTLEEAAATSGVNDVAVISFLWHAGALNYKGNWNKAFEKGQSLSALLQQVNQFYKGNTTVLCHSMGSRFFEGMLHDQTILPVFQHVILFSADLSSDTSDPGFVSILNATKHISIFQHRKDKPLLISSRVHGNNRMGRTGPEPAIANLITIYDMTDHIHGFQNHAHINKKWVKEKLITQLF